MNKNFFVTLAALCITVIGVMMGVHCFTAEQQLLQNTEALASEVYYCTSGSAVCVRIERETGETIVVEGEEVIVVDIQIFYKKEK